MPIFLLSLGLLLTGKMPIFLLSPGQPSTAYDTGLDHRQELFAA
jgi:hypothetical protein